MGRQIDKHSTADDVLADCNLTGRLAVVTGAAAGIGRETARALAACGADVIACGRNKEAIASAADHMSMATGRKVRPLTVDLLSLRSVQTLAQELLSLGKPIDLLILNAGIMACPLARNSQGIESQLATNFIGHAYLVSLLVPALLGSHLPRIVTVSSTAHQMSPVIFEDINYERRLYDPWEAYAQSKTAVALLAVRVWDALGARGVTAHTLHPGGIRTGLLKHMTGDIAESLSRRYNADMSGVQVKSVAQGAATTALAVTAPHLHGIRTVYLEDCEVAPVIDAPLYVRGVMRYALDSGNAARLWKAAEIMTGTEMPLVG